MSKSAVARGASMAASMWSKLDEAVKAKGGTEDALHVLDKKEGAPLIDVIADILVKAELKILYRFPITVDYSQSLKDMIAAGKYDWTNEYITAENFPIQGNGTVNLEIVPFHPNRDIKSEDVVKELDQMGLRPATLPELCAYGAKYPETQREFPIVGLGSSWVGPRGRRYVPYLRGYSRGRGLDLDCWVGEWDARYRFAAVRK